MSDRMPGEAVTIRPGRTDDAVAVTEIWVEMAGQHRLYDAERWDWADDAALRWSAWFRSAVASPEMLVLVAEDASSRPVGYLMARLGENPPVFRVRSKAEVFDLDVRSGHRRRGIGRRLMEEAYRALRERGAEEITLFVAAANTEVLAFYEAMGLRVTLSQMYRRL